MAYQLTIDDLEATQADETPPIRAARNPNPAVLDALLSYYRERASHLVDLPRSEQLPITELSPNADVSGALWGTYESPLTAAIRAKLPHNVKLLLSAGADSNGIKAHDLSDYSVRFLRGRDARVDTSSFRNCPPRTQLIATARNKGITHQTMPLTPSELGERRIGFPRFWTEPNVPGQRLRMRPALTALEVAAQCGCEDILDMLHSAGADDSAWRMSSESEQISLLEIPAEPPMSALSVSSPVHQAITVGNQSMLDKLLNTYEYSPNYRPLVAPTVALPPLSFALAQCDLANPGVRACIGDLLAHPRLILNLRTPVFNVHPLHFAAARHDPDLLTWIAASIPSCHTTAGQTALGHTLLHVAALPLTANYTAKSSPAVNLSIHCARALDSKWLQHRLPSPRHINTTKYPEPPLMSWGNPDKQRPLASAERDAQLATIRLLLDWGDVDIQAQDSDGNTALHYLAGTLGASPRAVELVRGIDGGEEVWQSARNWCGLTPKQLWE